MKRLVMSLCILIYSFHLHALPEGYHATHGDASFDQVDDKALNITTSDKAIIEYSKFNIETNEKVHFNQPSADSAVLNRIKDENPSYILGSLTSTGKVFLINPSGICFGENSKVDVGSFVASTLNIDDGDFLKGKYRFDSYGAMGDIANHGAIKVSQEGFVALLANRVINTGAISANFGNILIGAGKAITIDFDGDELVNFTVDGPLKKALIENKGEITAGQVIMSMQTAENVLDSIINNEGIIKADKIVHNEQGIHLINKNGRIINEGSLIATNHQEGGDISLYAREITNHGIVDVSSQEGFGGIITLEGNRIEHTGKLHSDSYNSNGGGIFLTAQDKLFFTGLTTARSTHGNGGLVKVTYNDDFIFLGQALCQSKYGKNGVLWIDPTTIVVDDTDIPGDHSHIAASTLITNLNTTDVILQADESITIDHIIDSRSNTNSGNLTLLAPTISLNQQILLREGSALLGGSSNGIINVAAQANIQNAIDIAAEYATINVAAGTYNETLIIDRPITILGAQANVDPRVSAGLRTAGSASETIIDAEGASSYIINISDDNVTLNGLEIANNTTKDGIYSGGNDNLIVKYCLIHDIGYEAIRFKSSIDTTLDHNLAYNINENGFTINRSGSHNPTITNNEIHHCSGSSSCICVDGCQGTVTIEGNYLHDNTSASGIAGMNFTAGSAESPTQLSIKNNTITNNSFATALAERHADAISLYRFASQPGANDKIVIEGNEITNNQGSYTSGTGGSAINIEAVATLSSEIKNNTITDNEGHGIVASSCLLTVLGNTINNNNNYGVSLPSGNTGTSTITNNNISNNQQGGIYFGDIETPGSCTVSYNTITNNTNYGLFNECSTFFITATKNWWNDNKGPTNESNPHQSTSGDVVSGNVNFMPWYATNTTTSSSENVSLKHNDSTIAISNTINDAINCAFTNDILSIADGSYSENLALNMALTLEASLSSYTIDGDVTFNAKPIAITGAALTQGHRWYVTNNGLIQNAITAASANNTINIADGTYTENISINKTLSLNAQNSSYAIRGNITLDALDITMTGGQIDTGYSWYVTNSGSIQNAIVLSSTTNTINIANGSYAGDLNINKSLTLTGTTYTIDGDVTFDANPITVTGASLASGHSWYVTNNGLIQNAITASSATNTINIANGSYAGDLNINKSLTLTGTTYTIDGDVTFDANPIIVTGASLASGHSWYVTNNGLIQNAITASSATNTINIANGSYTGDLNINKSLTLTGTTYTIDGDVTFDANPIIVTGASLASGHSWYLTNNGLIQNAITASSATNTINIANGSYAGDLNINKSLTLTGTTYTIDGDVTFDANPITVTGASLASGHSWYVTNNALIQNAINAAKNFDIINIYDGIYNEDLIVNKQLKLVSLGDGYTIGDITFEL